MGKKPASNAPTINLRAIKDALPRMNACARVNVPQPSYATIRQGLDLSLIDRRTIMMVTQCLAPSHLPTAADGGCNSTNVMKKSETARLRSSGVAPISVLKSRIGVNHNCPRP